MRTLNDIFPGVFCITLEVGENPSHPERLVAACREFARAGISVEFVEGVDGRKLDISEPMSRDGDSVVRKADMGCTLSHLKVVQMAKKRNLPRYFVFEDDVVLADNFQERFYQAMCGVPAFWKMIYAGGDNQLPNSEPTLNNLVKGTNRTLTTHAFGATQAIYNDLIRVLYQHEKVDLNISELHTMSGCFTMHPPLAGQRPGWSYILSKEVQNEHEFFRVK